MKKSIVLLLFLGVFSIFLKSNELDRSLDSTVTIFLTDIKARIKIRDDLKNKLNQSENSLRKVISDKIICLENGLRHVFMNLHHVFDSKDLPLFSELENEFNMISNCNKPLEPSCMDIANEVKRLFSHLESCFYELAKLDNRLLLAEEILSNLIPQPIPNLCDENYLMGVAESYVDMNKVLELVDNLEDDVEESDVTINWVLKFGDSLALKRKHLRIDIKFYIEKTLKDFLFENARNRFYSRVKSFLDREIKPTKSILKIKDWFSEAFNADGSERELFEG